MLVERMRPFTSTIFTEISRLAVETGAINLGQGFPDTDGPESLLSDAARNITGHGLNQYAPGPGVPALREAVAAHQRRFYGLDVDPADVVVTFGATEAIASTLLGLCEPGDEVVTFEPFYDSYAAAIALSGATRRTVPLRGRDFVYDPDELRAAFSERTTVVLVNTPHNPTGTVFSHLQLTEIGRLAAEFDAVVVTDEVYEHMTFDGTPHVPMATLPGMAERTLTISSAGKTFSVTGWKVGWAVGPAELVGAVLAAKQWLTFTSGAPLQPAAAVALDEHADFPRELAADLGLRRDLLCAGLADAGLPPYRPDGTYFVTTDISHLGWDDGREFCLSLPERAGVVAIPAQFLYDPDGTAHAGEGRHLVRWAFCKDRALLEEAARRLGEADLTP